MGGRGLAFMVVCVWKAAYVNDAGNGWRPLGFGFRLSAFGASRTLRVLMFTFDYIYLLGVLLFAGDTYIQRLA